MTLVYFPGRKTSNCANPACAHLAKLDPAWIQQIKFAKLTIVINECYGGIRDVLKRNFGESWTHLEEGTSLKSGAKFGIHSLKAALSVISSALI